MRRVWGYIILRGGRSRRAAQRYSRPSDGGRQLLHVGRANPKCFSLQVTSSMVTGKRLLRGRPQQPPPKNVPKGTNVSLHTFKYSRFAYGIPFIIRATRLLVSTCLSRSKTVHRRTPARVESLKVALLVPPRRQRLPLWPAWAHERQLQVAQAREICFMKI